MKRHPTRLSLRCLFLLLLLALPALACGLTEGEPTAVPTATPSPTLPLRATASLTSGPTRASTPTAVPTPLVSPTRRQVVSTNTPTPEPTAAPATSAPGSAVPTGVNLLTNPSFEAPFLTYLGRQEFNVAQGWIPWYDESSFAPEFKPAEAPYYNRIHGGERAQQYFKTMGTYRAGVYQRVAVAPGVKLRFTIYGQAWSHDGSSDCPIEQSCNPANMGMRIGIDVSGGSNPKADSIKWSGVQSPTSGWAAFSVEAVAESDVVTVFTWSAPDAAKRNQDTYWDDASLQALQ